MRRRLVTAFVGIAVVLVVLYGGPRFFMLTSLVESEQQDRVDRAADLVALHLETGVGDGEPITSETLERLVGEDERLTYTSGDGEDVSVPPRAWPDADISASRELDGGGTVTLTLSDEVVDDAVRSAVLPLLVLGVLLIVVAGVAGLLLSRRLSRPFTELASVAEELGRGRLDQEVPRYGVPEADAIGRALQDSGQRLERMLRRERDVAVYASHELRTPITALRLTLEDLTMWPQTTPEVSAELHRIIGEVDRFSAAVTSLLEQSHDETMHRAEPLDLADVVAECVRSAEPAARSRGQRFAVDGAASLPVRLPRTAVVRAVDLLLERAASEAEGPITVRLTQETTHDAVSFTYATASGGPTVAVEASEIASALGGRVVNDCGPPPRLVLMLPREDVVAGLGMQ